MQLSIKETYSFQPALNTGMKQKLIEKNATNPNYAHLNTKAIQKFILR